MATREGKLRARAAAATKSIDQLFSLEHLEPRQLLAFSALINFQPPGVQTPSGYRADTRRLIQTVACMLVQADSTRKSCHLPSRARSRRTS